MAPAGSWLVNFTETKMRSCGLRLNPESLIHLGPARGQALSPDPRPSLSLDPSHVLSIERGETRLSEQVWTVEMLVLLLCRGVGRPMGTFTGFGVRLAFKARLCHFLTA